MNRNTVAASYRKITHDPGVVRVTGREELSPFIAILFAALSGLAAWWGYEKGGPAFADYNGFTADDTPPEFLLVNFRLPFMILLFGFVPQILLDLRRFFVRIATSTEENTRLLGGHERSENPNMPSKEIALHHQDKWELAWQSLKLVLRRLFHHGLAFCPSMLPPLPEQLNLIIDSDWLADPENRLFLSKFLTAFAMLIEAGLAKSGLDSHERKYTFFYKNPLLVEYKPDDEKVEKDDDAANVLNNANV